MMMIATSSGTNEQGREATVTKGLTRLGRFAQVAQALNNEYGVSRATPGGKTLGHWALLVDDKIFARSSVAGHFVVRLPKERVDSLVSAGLGRRLAYGSCYMKEWLAVHGQSAEEWVELARESLRFVRRLD